MSDMEKRLEKIADERGAEAAWRSMSMGAGRKLKPYGTCDKSPDGKHHYTAISCVQSVEEFRCDYCGRTWVD